MNRERDYAIQALRRGTPDGKPIPPCSCFKPDGSKRDCSKGLCEDAIDWVEAAIRAGRRSHELQQIIEKPLTA